MSDDATTTTTAPAPSAAEVEAYQRAAALSGRTVPQLQAMARQVFGSMLHHLLASPGAVIWTTASLVDGQHLSIEVNNPPRREMRRQDAESAKTAAKQTV